MFDELAERPLMSPLAGMKHTYVRLAIVIFSQNINSLFNRRCRRRRRRRSSFLNSLLFEKSGGSVPGVMVYH